MRRFAVSLLALTLTLLPVSPAFAQLGDIAPPPVEAVVATPPAPVVEPTPPPAEVTPEPVVEPVAETIAPVVASDTTPPAISGVASLSLGINDATLVWTTDELAVSTLEYGTTLSYGMQATIGVSALLAHTAVLTGLSANTTYYYCIHATDLAGLPTGQAGNTANSCLPSQGGHSFTTATHTVIADTTPPDVTLITEGPITTTSATISFTTSEVGNARIEYGTTVGYGETTSLDTNLALTHAVTLSNLTPNTLYHYRIITSDEVGNETVSSDETFMTEAESVESGQSGAGVTVSNPESTTVNTSVGSTSSTSSGQAGSPQVGSVSASILISGIELASIGTSTVTIAWTTNLSSDSQVEYGDSDNLGSLTTLSSTLTTSHSVTISGLTQNTNYIFRVKSKPLGATVATVSENDEFNTLTHSIPVVAGPNIISVSSGSVTSTGATIVWSTDKAATSQVEYGISSGYGVLSAENATRATSHSISLTDLEPSTMYHFRVKSTDEVSNITFSEDYTFTTSATSSGNSVSNVGGSSTPTAGSTTSTDSTSSPQAGSGQANSPHAITTLTIGGYDNASAELEWHVGTANTDVAAEYDVRYSTSPIDASNFAQATQAQITPIYYGDVSPIGEERAYIVAGLSANTTYYFAIKSKHENSSYSDISNIVSATTTGGVTAAGGTPPEAVESINNESNQNQNSILEVSTSLGHVVVSSGYGSSSTGSGSSSGGGGGGGGGGGTSAGPSINSGQGSFEPTLVKAEPADGQIIFEWNNPDEANFVRTIVVKKEGSYPTSPSDGQTIYEGRGDTYADTSLQNGKTYYYAVYSYNHSKTYSRGVNISLAPNAGNKQVKFNESGSLASSTPVLHFVRTWQKGDKDIEIEHLQEILVADKDSYPEKYVTGYFGSLTQAALKRFQVKHGLSQTGIVDIATQQKLNTVSHSETKLNIPMDVVVFATDLKRGDQGEAVKDLQQYLIYEGSYVEAIMSGYFGNYTHNAVKTFQAKYGISPISGFVGYKTRHRMQQLSGF